MSMNWLGYAGTALVIVAYLPQIGHLIREHCSAGLSFPAYCLWGVAAFLLLIYAIAVKDPVFMALQAYQFAVTGIICFLSHRYKGFFCEDHGGPAETPPG